MASAAKAQGLLDFRYSGLDRTLLNDDIDFASDDSQWRIDKQLCTVDGERSPTQCGFCSPVGATQRQTHFAKWLTEKPHQASDGRAGRATLQRSWLYFQRQAIVATHLWQLTASQLDAPQPLLVFPRWSGARLDRWLASQSQVSVRSEWVAIACALLRHLEGLHRSGFVHGQLCLEHVWLTANEEVRLLGLGRCEAVGQAADNRWSESGSDARQSMYIPPEQSDPNAEVSSAEDIYAAAAVIDELCHGQFCHTPVGRCMRAENPYDRPTASELVELFASYHAELTGSFGTNVARRAAA